MSELAWAQDQLRPDPDDGCPAGRLWYTEEPEKEAAAIAAWNRRAPLPSIPHNGTINATEKANG